MKKTILSVLFVSLSASMMSAQAANSDAALKAQFDSQKELITDNKFYPATSVLYTNAGVFVPTFKEQLDSQKDELTDYTFYPATAVSYKKALTQLVVPTNEQDVPVPAEGYDFHPADTVIYTDDGVMLPSMKAQLDSQKDTVHDYTFYPANNVYYTKSGVYAPTVKAQLDSQKQLVTDYKLYPANNVSYK